MTLFFFLVPEVDYLFPDLSPHMDIQHPNYFSNLTPLFLLYYCFSGPQPVSPGSLQLSPHVRPWPTLNFLSIGFQSNQSPSAASTSNAVYSKDLNLVGKTVRAGATPASTAGSYLPFYALASVSVLWTECTRFDAFVASSGHPAFLKSCPSPFANPYIRTHLG